jgi:uracil-DNA glycosylase
MATPHPSSVLRAPDPEARRAQRELLVKDLMKVGEAIAAAVA